MKILDTSITAQTQSAFDYNLLENGFINYYEKQNMILSLWSQSLFNVIIAILMLSSSICLLAFFYNIKVKNSKLIILNVLSMFLIFHDLFLNTPITNYIVNDRYLIFIIVTELNYLFLYVLFIIALIVNYNNLKTAIVSITSLLLLLINLIAFNTNLYSVKTYINYNLLIICVLFLFMVSNFIMSKNKLKLSIKVNYINLGLLIIVSNLVIIYDSKIQVLIAYFILALLYVITSFYWVVNSYIVQNKTIKEDVIAVEQEISIVKKFEKVRLNSSDNNTIENIIDNFYDDLINTIGVPKKYFIVLVKNNNNIIFSKYSDDYKYNNDLILRQIIKQRNQNTLKNIQTENNKIYATVNYKSDEYISIYIENNNVLSSNEINYFETLNTLLKSSLNNLLIFNNNIETQEEILKTTNKIIIDKSKSYEDISKTSELCYKLALNMGIKEKDANNFRLAVYIYNIGKLALPDQLNNIDTTYQTQINYFMEHTTLGYEMLSNLNNPIMDIASKCALDHHEEYDGSGYHNKEGYDIDYYARMLKIVIGLVKKYDKNYLEMQKKLGTKEKISNYESRKCLDNAFLYLVELSEKSYDKKIVDVFISNKIAIENLILK